MPSPVYRTVISLYKKNCITIHFLSISLIYMLNVKSISKQHLQSCLPIGEQQSLFYLIQAAICSPKKVIITIISKQARLLVCAFRSTRDVILLLTKTGCVKYTSCSSMQDRGDFPPGSQLASITFVGSLPRSQQDPFCQRDSQKWAFEPRSIIQYKTMRIWKPGRHTVCCHHPANVKERLKYLAGCCSKSYIHLSVSLLAAYQTLGTLAWQLTMLCYKVKMLQNQTLWVIELLFLKYPCI